MQMQISMLYIMILQIEIVLEAIQKNTPFTVQVSPTGLSQGLRLQSPSTQQIV